MSSPGVISYPIPLYQNVPIQPQNYKPRRFNIASIALGFTTTVTTSSPNDYVLGQQVRFIIPPTFGTRQLNEVQGYVISIASTTQFTVDVDSVGMDAFILSTEPSKAQILAIGDIRSGAINSHGRERTKPFIPGSFRNISPQP